MCRITSTALHCNDIVAHIPHDGLVVRTSKPSGPPLLSAPLAERACIASYISLGWLHSFFSAAHACHSLLSVCSPAVWQRLIMPAARRPA